MIRISCSGSPCFDACTHTPRILVGTFAGDGAALTVAVVDRGREEEFVGATLWQPLRMRATTVAAAAHAPTARPRLAVTSRRAPDASSTMQRRSMHRSSEPRRSGASGSTPTVCVRLADFPVRGAVALAIPPPRCPVGRLPASGAGPEPLITRVLDVGAVGPQKWGFVPHAPRVHGRPPSREPSSQEEP